jgi:DNA-binding GntR family transcriptional regulator
MTVVDERTLKTSTPRSDNTAQITYDLLRQEILIGSLSPGAVLSQVQIATRLGISRTPLREALRRLAAEDLITGDFNQRVRVSELDLDDFDEIYAMRIVLEPLAFAATIPNLAESSLRSLADAITRMDEMIDSGDRTGFRNAHRDFHLGLTTGAGPRMQRTLAELWDRSERYRLRYLHPEGPDVGGVAERGVRLAQTEHRDILEAASAGDVTRCADAELHHLQRTLEAVLREAAPPPQARLSRLAVGTRQR